MSVAAKLVRKHETPAWSRALPAFLSAIVLIWGAWSSAIAVDALDDDGSAAAPRAPAQYPTLLREYTVRPPWRVAGVDYAVGYPASTALRDWRSITQNGVAVDDPDRIVTVTGDSVVLEAIDFSLHGGAQLVLRGNGDIIRNSKFVGPASVSTGVIDVFGSGVTVVGNVIDGGGVGGEKVAQSCLIFVRAGGQVVIEYNWLRNMPARAVEFLGNTATRVLYRFNLIENGGLAVGSHMNYLESDGAGPYFYTVKFNTSRQTVPPQGPGEGYQFYCNTACTLGDPVVAYNTMISVRPGAMSFLIHGSAVGHTILLGRAGVQFNYVDARSAYGFLYPRSFPDWLISGNVDMVSGSTPSSRP